MKTVAISARPLAILLGALLCRTPSALADGCNLPTFGGARLFGAAGGSQALATGDFNADGITDLATVNSSGSISVLLGLGDGTFQPAVTYPMRNPSWIVTADFNGDGKLDLAVSADLRIFFMAGNGDGTFKAGVSTSTPATAMSVGDFNGDGRPDLAITGTPAYILLGRGDGTFQSPAAPPGGIVAGIGVIAGDFNGDGKTDVIAGTQGGVSVMLGDGAGKLAAAVASPAGTSFLPDSLAAGDVNGDRKLDVITVTALDRKVAVLLGNGNGTFQAAINYPIGELANGLVIADLNGDGVPDLAVNNHTSINAPGTISVFAGAGDGTFQEPVQYNPTVQANWALAAGDFNRDGAPDLLFTSIVQSLPTQIGVIFGNGDGTFQSPRGFASGGPLPRTPALADFNGDGVLDMAVPNAGLNAKMAVLIGNPDGTFQEPVNYNTAFGAKSVATGDMNGDGIVDIVVANGSASNLLVFLGAGDGAFQSPKASGSLFLSTYVTLGDFNNDGRLDAAVRGIGGAQVVLGNGDGTFRAGVGTFGGICAGCGQGPVAAKDLNGDGNLDLVLSNGDTDLSLSFGKSGTVTVLLGKGDGTFLAPVDYTVGSNVTSVAIGDLNGDGIPDLAVSDFGGSANNAQASGALAVLLGNADGTFQAAVKYSSGKGASWAVIGDFDGDTVNDVAVVGRASRTVTVYLGSGDGTLRNALSYGAGGDPVGLAVADLNADGKPDLLVGDQLTNSVLALLNTLKPETAVSACAAVPALSN